VFSPPSEVAIQRVASLFIEKYPAKMDEARVEDGVHCSLTQSIKESGRRRQHGFSCAGWWSQRMPHPIFVQKALTWSICHLPVIHTLAFLHMMHDKKWLPPITKKGSAFPSSGGYCEPLVVFWVSAFGETYTRLYGKIDCCATGEPGDIWL
jgi:hypothetical protein